MTPDLNKTRKISPKQFVDIGQSTHFPDETAIRCRYVNARGKYSPRGSSELYLRDLKLLMVIAAEENLFGANDCAEIIEKLAASIRFRPPKKSN
jgi:hypothetical protein